jgi:glycosyltransferase involved in cell wall biosynthesis
VSAGDPLVSVITPSYNQAAYLESALLSVLRQDYPHLEYIVIDGGSTDGSREILERYDDQLTYWTSEPDQGQADAINKGLRMATGAVVAWLNSDDMYMSGAVREAVEALEKNPQAGMVYGDGLMVDANGRLLDKHRYRGYGLEDLLHWEVLLQPTSFMRTQALREVGYLSSRYHYILDHELWIRIAARYPIVHVPSFWAVERTHIQAKTVAQAAVWVEEGRDFIERAESDPMLGPIIEDDKRSFNASFQAFAARRLIDAHRFRAAVGCLLKALSMDPAVVLRYWYKLVQAFFSWIGFHRVFLLYRSLRRRIQFSGRKVIIGEQGAEIVRERPSS